MKWELNSVYPSNLPNSVADVSRSDELDAIIHLGPQIVQGPGPHEVFASRFLQPITLDGNSMVLGIRAIDFRKPRTQPLWQHSGSLLEYRNQLRRDLVHLLLRCSTLASN